MELTSINNLITKCDFYFLFFYTIPIFNAQNIIMIILRTEFLWTKPIQDTENWKLTKKQLKAH